MAFRALCLLNISMDFFVIPSVRGITRKALVLADKTDRYEGSCKHLDHHSNGKKCL